MGQSHVQRGQREYLPFLSFLMYNQEHRRSCFRTGAVPVSKVCSVDNRYTGSKGYIHFSLRKSIRQLSSCFFFIKTFPFGWRRALLRLSKLKTDVHKSYRTQFAWHGGTCLQHLGGQGKWISRSSRPVYSTEYSRTSRASYMDKPHLKGRKKEG